MTTRHQLSRCVLAPLLSLLIAHCTLLRAQISTNQAVGYEGIWFTLGQQSEYGDKYSGGLGTYTAKHIPLAIHCPEVNKTFFVYGGTKPGQQHLLAMIGYYDHARDVVPHPTIVHDKQGVNDPHDNPSLAVDDQGHLWVFVSGRGRHRPGFKYRSVRPYDISAFERVTEEEMTYPQPWWVPQRGFLHLFTKYTGVRELYWNTSPDGRTWSDHRKLAGMGGHYQVSNRRGNRVITAFSYHPGGHPDRRTNLYFAETRDLGETWQNAAGITLTTPLTDPQTPALVRDYESEKRLVYLKDINFDVDGAPLILFITAAAHQPGPVSDPRSWTLARWTREGWSFQEITPAFHNYDMGSLYVEAPGVYRIIAPTAVGPQRYGTGGEICQWLSLDKGRTWVKQRDLTANSRFNHAYARRPVNAHPGFYAFWADGNPDEPSPSRLYFTDREGKQIRRLPDSMPGQFATPEHVR